MKVYKICTNYQYCSVFVCFTCPPGRSGNLSTQCLSKFGNFLSICRNSVYSVDKAAHDFKPISEGGVVRLKVIFFFFFF